MAGTWSAKSMVDALPTVPVIAAKNGMSAPAEDGTVQKKWAEPLKYDYSAMEGPERDNVWDGNVRVYEWDGEEGDVGPEHPELERELFGDPEKRLELKGIDFAA